MKKTLLILLTLLLAASLADFSARKGYGRFGFRAAYPIALTDPLGYGDNYGGNYTPVIYGALEGGIGFNDYLELTLGLNIHFANASVDNVPALDLSAGEGSVCAGLTAYFIKGDIRPYGHLDLGVSFHYSDYDNTPGYNRSVGLALGVGVGCQFVLGGVFYLEPFVHYRLHGNGSYTFNVDLPGYEPVDRDFEETPMVLCTGLGFGFLF